jgi:hypothetical protein
VSIVDRLKAHAAPAYNAAGRPTATSGAGFLLAQHQAYILVAWRRGGGGGCGKAAAAVLNLVVVFSEYVCMYFNLHFLLEKIPPITKQKTFSLQLVYCTVNSNSHQLKCDIIRDHSIVILAERCRCPLGWKLSVYSRHKLIYERAISTQKYWDGCGSVQNILCVKFTTSRPKYDDIFLLF